MDKHGLQHSAAEAKAFKTLCRTAFACEADAQQALATLTQALQTTAVQDGTIHPTPRYGQHGRPGPDSQPPRMVYHLAGALASVVARREALVAQQSCFILATNALDTTQWSPQALLEAYKGQQRAERGVRCLKDPHVLASSLSLKTPERIMALLMVMTVCWLVYAALEYRIRKALKDHETPFPNHTGKPGQHPTARWVLHDCAGVHLLLIPGRWPQGLNLTEVHQHLLQLLGKP